MSTVFDFRNLRLPKLSRASVIVGALAIVLALVLAFVGFQLYKKLTNNTVVAYFPEANALYSGDRVEIMGVKVGAVDKIEPAGDKMKVTFHYSNKYKVPADAQAGDPQPDPGGVAADPAGAALQGRSGAGRQRGDPRRAHPGAHRVGPAAQHHHQRHLQIGAH